MGIEQCPDELVAQFGPAHAALDVPTLVEWPNLVPMKSVRASRQVKQVDDHKAGRHPSFSGIARR